MTDETKVTNEIIETTDELIEVPSTGNGKKILIIGGVSAIALGAGVALWKFAIKPCIAKIRARKKNAELEHFEVEDLEDFENTESFK